MSASGLCRREIDGVYAHETMYFLCAEFAQGRDGQWAEWRAVVLEIRRVYRYVSKE